MTPIQFIAWAGVHIFTVDYADQKQLQCLATNTKNAQWLATSLAAYHKVDVVELDEITGSVVSRVAAA